MISNKMFLLKNLGKPLLNAHLCLPFTSSCIEWGVQSIIPAAPAMSVVQLILSLTTNWGDTGSIDQYVSWSSTADQHEQFFSDADCRQLYKSFVKTVLSRVNTINGRR